MAPDEGSRSDLVALLEPRVGRDAALELMIGAVISTAVAVLGPVRFG